MASGQWSVVGKVILILGVSVLSSSGFNEILIPLCCRT